MDKDTSKLPEIGDIVTILSKSDIMEGLQAEVCGLHNHMKNKNIVNFVVVKFSEKIIGQCDMIRLLHSNGRGYYDGLKPVHHCENVIFFDYLPESLRIDVNGYTDDNKKKLQSSLS